MYSLDLLEKSEFPVLPNAFFYKLPKPYRPGIKRNFYLVSQNRCRIEKSKFYKGICNEPINIIKNDITLPHHIIVFRYMETSGVNLVLNY